MEAGKPSAFLSATLRPAGFGWRARRS